MTSLTTYANSLLGSASGGSPFTTLTNATGTVSHDCLSSRIFYHTTPAANWTVNFTNLNLNAENLKEIKIIVVQDVTPYIPNAIEIAGVAQTLNWKDNIVPTGTASATDLFRFEILNDGGTYIVYGQKG
jgi:hypothetical protein